MSAIYGAIDLKGDRVDSKLFTNFVDEYKNCVIDRNEHILDDNVLMGCGIQYFYKRAEKEKLPFKDEGSDIFITADCVLDNYIELKEELGLNENAADGDIILAGYRKWGRDCVSHFRGLFAFVIYSKEKNEIYAAVDQFSQRCLFYHIRNGIFYFSTLFFPLLQASGLKFEENERWLVDTVSLRSPVMLTEPKETALKDVVKVVSGTYIVVNFLDNDQVNISEKRYYDPKKTIPTEWTMTLEESEKLVRKTMTDVLEKILREQDNVAAQLSSGLDSSTVACNAAIILKKRGGKVFSYTSVPNSDAGMKNTRGTLYDESDIVKLICSQYDNIIPSFVECKDRDFLEKVPDYINFWELPCKSQQNAVWIEEISKQAHSCGNRIILSGSTGNCTLSAGNSTDLAYYYFKHFHFIKAYHMFDIYKKYGISRKEVFSYLLQDIIKYYKWYFDSDDKDCYKNNVTRRDIGEKYNLTKRFRKHFMHYYPFASMEKMRKDMYILNANAQIGEIEVKDSLKNGILSRDPMRTVEFNEMCFRIPIYCYAERDYDRRLVRVGMKGIVPEEVRCNVFQRGRQSGDNLFRVSRCWNKIRSKWTDSVYSKEVLHYLDKNKIDNLVKVFDKGIEKADYIDVLLIGDLYAFSLFLSKVSKYSNSDLQ
ncbi:MAG: hypothetical protein IJR29_03505 [Butyrivibrio sp.]|nr:hypothetical protein [Butyrivibrio sp.]